MAAYAFETMSASDAAAFTSSDYLFFITNGASATGVTVTPYSNGSSGTLTSSGTIVSYGGKSLTFSSTDISTASTSGHIQFNDSSQLLIGTSATGSGANATTGNDTLTFTNTVSSAPTVVFGLGGSDTIGSNTANGNNYLYGGTDNTTSAQLNGTQAASAGLGGDTITAGNGNNHIYGNALTTQQGAVDGNDSITAGAGSNVINGNGGNDYITVGAAASTGSNRVFGGSGNDHITILGAGTNNVNGNIGNDYIDASAATGNNGFSGGLRGGQGNDTILAGRGQDVIQGDAGADSLVAGTGATTTTNGVTTYGHLTIMTGGADADTFDFSATGAGDAGSQMMTTGQNGTVYGPHSGIIVNGSAFYQTITDFQQGTDHIHLAFTPATADILRAQAGATFTTVAAAENYAQTLLTNHATAGITGGGEVAAIDVNGSTYLFFNHTGTGAIDSIVQLSGVTASTLTQSTANGAATFS